MFQWGAPLVHCWSSGQVLLSASSFSTRCSRTLKPAMSGAVPDSDEAVM